MAFPIRSPHHLSLNGVLFGTTSQPKATLSSSAGIGINDQNWRNIYMLLH